MLNSSVRMVLHESRLMLTLDMRNEGSSDHEVSLSFELPFISRLYDEVETGYECCSPVPKPATDNVSSTWQFDLSDFSDKRVSSQFISFHKILQHSPC